MIDLSKLPEIDQKRAKQLMERTSVFSGDAKGADGQGNYRYTLWRRGMFANTDPCTVNIREGFVAFICLNPSTATEKETGPTVRRIEDLARSWKFNSAVMLNAFAWRATDPKDMLSAEKPEGNFNDFTLTVICSQAARVIVAWGNNGAFNGRSKRVCDILKRIGVQPWALSVTQSGQPQHPLLVPDGCKPVKYIHP